MRVLSGWCRDGAARTRDACVLFSFSSIYFRRTKGVISLCVCHLPFSRRLSRVSRQVQVRRSGRRWSRQFLHSHSPSKRLLSRTLFARIWRRPSPSLRQLCSRVQCSFEVSSERDNRTSENLTRFVGVVFDHCVGNQLSRNFSVVARVSAACAIGNAVSMLWKLRCYVC